MCCVILYEQKSQMKFQSEVKGCGTLLPEDVQRVKAEQE